MTLKLSQGDRYDLNLNVPLFPSPDSAGASQGEPESTVLYPLLVSFLTAARDARLAEDPSRALDPAFEELFKIESPEEFERAFIRMSAVDRDDLAAVLNAGYGNLSPGEAADLRKALKRDYLKDATPTPPRPRI